MVGGGVVGWWVCVVGGGGQGLGAGWPKAGPNARTKVKEIVRVGVGVAEDVRAKARVPGLGLVLGLARPRTPCNGLVLMHVWCTVPMQCTCSAHAMRAVRSVW